MKAREKKAPEAASPGNLLTGWARQGVQSFVAAQKILMDLAAQENALLIGMVREGLAEPGARLGVSVAAVAEKGVRNLTAVGKILLDLAAEETALAVDGVKEGLRLPVPAGAMAEVVRHRVDTFLEMQKNLLDATAEQAHEVAESYRAGGKMLSAAHVTEMARRGMAGFVESEKKFLDLAAEEVSAATKGEKHAAKPPRKRMEVLTVMAREGAEKYIETQRKLLELAIEQLEEATKTGREQKKGVVQGNTFGLGRTDRKEHEELCDRREVSVKPGHEADRRSSGPEGDAILRPDLSDHQAAARQRAGNRRPSGLIARSGRTGQRKSSCSLTRSNAGR